jgi:hypothetical protein
MRIVGNVLIGLGAVFAIIIALFAWVGVSGAHFKQAEAPFVTRFLTDLSRHWNVADVYDRSANSLVEQAASAQGQQVLQTFKQLGSLRSTRDFEMRNYYRGTSGETAVFSMKATFENGDAIVEVTLQRRDGAVRVMGFTLRAVEMQNHAGAKPVAAPSPAGRKLAIISLPS